MLELLRFYLSDFIPTAFNCAAFYICLCSIFFYCVFALTFNLITGRRIRV